MYLRPRFSELMNNIPDEVVPSSTDGRRQARLDSLPEIKSELRTFAQERDWEQYHTPRNLVLALVGEVGELSEIFQWKGEVSPGLPGFTNAERTHLGEELSDCLLYLVRLADVSGVDLGAAVAAKLQANARKYPVDKCKGRSTKYTELQQGAES